MATRSTLLALLNGLPISVDLTQDELQVLSLRVGGAAGTELTKAILDKLVALQDGSDFSDGTNAHTHDGRYFTETELQSSGAASGSDLVGDDATYSNFTPAAATVKGALSGIDTALASAGSDENVKVSANDTTPGFLNGKLVQGTGIDLTENNDAGNETLSVTLEDTAVTPASYGDAQTVATFTVDQQGRMTAAGTATIDDTTKIPLSQKGAASGVATLDAGGKIPSAQVPAIAITEVFSVADITARDALTIGAGAGEVQEGDVVIVTDASADAAITSGAAAYIYDGSAYKLLKAGDEVLSVNGETGVVTLSTTDISEGSNLYHTDERSQDSVGSILTDTATIDLTYDDATPTITADVIDASIDSAKLAASVAGDGLTGGAGTALAVGAGDGISVTADAVAVVSAPQSKLSLVAGEELAADTSFLVRWALTGETAGRVYKADSAAAVADGKFYAFGIALSGSLVSAGGSVDVVTMGSHTLGSSDSAFLAAEVGLPVYLTDAGAFSITPPADSGDAIYRVGMVQSTSAVWIDSKQLNGVVA